MVFVLGVGIAEIRHGHRLCQDNAQLGAILLDKMSAHNKLKAFA
jgi:hypothetical protein